MAYRNQLIHSPKTGHEFLFLHPGQFSEGRFLGIVATFGPNQLPPILYYHPHQSVDFDVLKGELTVQLDGERLTLQPGDHLLIRARQIYSLWNESHQQTSINCRIRPALNTEHLLESVTTFANADQEPDSHWKYQFRQLLLARQFAGSFRRVHRPFALQRVLFVLLTPVQYWMNGRSPKSGKLSAIIARFYPSPTIPTAPVASGPK